MFSLAAGFWNLAVAKQELNILVVGLPGSGKTVIMEQQKRRFVKGYRGRLPEQDMPDCGVGCGGDYDPDVNAYRYSAYMLVV